MAVKKKNKSTSTYARHDFGPKTAKIDLCNAVREFVILVFVDLLCIRGDPRRRAKTVAAVSQVPRAILACKINVRSKI